MISISLKNFKKFIILLIQFGSIYLLYNWCFRSVNWNLFFELVLNANPLFFSIVLLQRYVPWIILGLRLKTFFQSKINFIDGIKASLICVGLNSVLPSRAGDIAKIGWLKINNRISFYELLGGIFIERLLDVSLLSIVLITVLISSSFRVFAILLLLIAILMWIVILIIKFNPKFILSFFCFIRKRQIISWIAHVLWNTKKKLVVETLIKTSSYSILIWIMNFLHVFLVITLLTDINISIYESCLLFIAVFASSAFGIVPGGIGIMESSVIYVCTALLKYDVTYALVIATYFRFFYSIPSVISASFVFITYKYNLSEDQILKNNSRDRK
ncbi:MAG: lysylphosphatidylglycerol synthase transmembrane domain-containing protein [Succinivibrio sp.]